MINDKILNMKTSFKLFTLLAAVFCLAACHPDEEHPRDIVYIVAGNTTTVHLETESEWQNLLDRFCDYAEGGDSVTFYNASNAAKGVATKEVTEFSTTSRDEMKQWMSQMEDAGKTVTVTYDRERGLWHGRAYATAPHHPQNDYWVDLGLPSGLLWAKCNVGATQPEDSGYFYAWGEILPKDDYSWDTYRYCVNGDDHSLTKYCHLSIVGYNGYTDTLTVLQPNDDAATMNIGNGARTPTYYEWKEIWDNCTLDWVTQNGVNGLRCTGPNGNSIFLPDAGHISGNHINTWGFYWTASVAVDIPCPGDIMTTGACSFEVNETGLHLYRSNRFLGMQVRAVRSK